ncbi:copper-binding protein [Mitsuaria sp. GD03876]|uniref:copper-binding protein n=1 Tax=Mitsuaria sp. GD03876 TaxID=2975399 RepID=UPI00244C96DE|nr:copper-binding protein [Mitsuaria sp. GD03876]MDH0864924.1 copper-binding protein [Mitsuaria sp. GD03876]
MNRIALSFAIALVTLIGAQTPLRAQAHSHEGHDQEASAASDAATPSSQDWVAAEVRRIDIPQQKLTLKHGDIRHLDMPGMTMPFKLAPGVLSAAQLSEVKIGDKVEVRIEAQQGQLTIVELRPAPAAN